MWIAILALALSISSSAEAQQVVPAAPDPPEQQVPAPKAPDPQEQKADAKEPPTPEHTGLRALFHDFGEDVTKLPALDNLYIAVAGGAGAAAVHPWDHSFNAHLQSTNNAVVNAFFAPGKYLGDTPEQIAMSLGTYIVGRWRDQPKVAHLGMDLLQAQLMTELLVEPLKFATHRLRPDGSNYQSFPSGHAAITFAAATVIERHLGWRKAALGYAIASYVAASRLHDNRHYLSDVVFGAAVGSIAGRTVVHHRADYWAVMPVATPDGGVALMVTRRNF